MFVKEGRGWGQGSSLGWKAALGLWGLNQKIHLPL